MNFKDLKYFTIFGEGERLTTGLLKNLWRKICVKVHPDKGGTNEKYIEAQNEYESLLKSVNAGFTAFSDSPEAFDNFTDFLANISPIVHDCLKAVIAIDGIKAVEITGYWVWVAIGFAQKAERKALKEISIDGKRFIWRKDHKKWVWRGVAASGWKKMNWEQKKKYWGYDKFEKEEDKQLTA